jgi:hypothetical protein
MDAQIHLRRQNGKVGWQVCLIHIVAIVLTFGGAWAFLNSDGKNGVDHLLYFGLPP